MDWSSLGTYWQDMKGPVQASLIIIGALIIFFLILFFILKKVDPLKKTPLWLVPFLWIVDLLNGFVKENIGKS